MLKQQLNVFVRYSMRNTVLNVLSNANMTNSFEHFFAYLDQINL